MDSVAKLVKERLESAQLDCYITTIFSIYYGHINQVPIHIRVYVYDVYVH